MRKHTWIASLLTAGVTAATLALAVPTVRVSAASPKADDPGNPEFYTAKVLPILTDNCFRCHGGMNHRGGLSLQTHAGMMKGGHDGAVVVPGHPEQSLLIKLIRHEGPANDPMPMPPKSKLSDDDIATVEQWIKAGAVMPEDPAQQ